MEPQSHSDNAKEQKDLDLIGSRLEQRKTRPTLRDITYVETKRLQIDIRESYIFGTHFHDCIVNTLNLDNCILINVIFKNCTVEDITLSNTYLEDVVFDSCDLSNILWQNMRLVDREQCGKCLKNDRVLRHDVPKEIADPAWLEEKIRAPPQFAHSRDFTAQQSGSSQGSHDSWPAVETVSAGDQRDPSWSNTIWPENTQGVRAHHHNGIYISTFQRANTPEPRECFKNWQTYVAPIERRTRTALRDGKLPWMKLPPNVRLLIYQELLCPSQLIITDTSRDQELPNRQLWYWMWNKYCQEKRKWKSTYIAGSPDRASLTTSMTPRFFI